MTTLKMVFQPFAERGTDQWREFGTDGNEFESVEDGWSEARSAAALGLPWAGATFRLIDVFKGEHTEGCSLGAGGEWCDCKLPEVVAEDVFLPPEGVYEKVGFGATYGGFTVKTRRVDMPEIGPLVVEATVEAAVLRNDQRTLQELSRLSEQKLAELWMGRDAQLQVLSNVLHGRDVPREKRHLIKERMKGRPLFELATVVAEVLAEHVGVCSQCSPGHRGADGLCQRHGKVIA